MTVAETQEATYQIWVELKANLHRFIARRTKHEVDAEDILQNVFVKIHSNIGSLKDTTKTHSWVYQITRNSIIDYYRSRRNELSIEESPDSFDMAREEIPESDAEREEILACLSPMMRRLPDDYRKALEMSDVRGITQAKVAYELNLSVSGAKSRVQRARGKMKNMLLNCCSFEFDARGRAIVMDSNDCNSSCGPEACN